MSSPVNHRHQNDSNSRAFNIDEEVNYGSISSSSEAKDNTMMDKAFDKAGGFGRY